MGDTCKIDARYEGNDGLKAYALSGMTQMHVLSNGGFGFIGSVFKKLILSFTNLYLCDYCSYMWIGCVLSMCPAFFIK